MKKILFISILSLFCLTIRGQVAKWIIPPAYNRIYMSPGANLIITDSAGMKILWTLEGKRLASTKSTLYPFNEERAIATLGSNGQIGGFYDTEGRFTRLNGCQMAHAYPYFSDGYILVKIGNYYCFADIRGQLDKHMYTQAYPFFNGYASCFTYKNLQKAKGPYNLLLTKELEEVSFSYEDRVFKEDDIDFISSVNDEGIGVVIVKRKVYLFNGKDRSLRPVMANKGDTSPKNQARLEDELTTCLLKETDSTSVLTARFGKTDKVQIRFNAFLVPLSMIMPNKELIWKKTAKSAHTFSTQLRQNEADGRTGLCWGDQEVLPPQFDKVVSCIDDKAFVCKSGKYGALKVFNDAQFQFTINKGNPINFRHQKYETTIRADLPPIVPTRDCSIEVAEGAGCEVDLTSCEKKNTEFGNYLQYKCTLTIPETLPDEMLDAPLNTITYPVTILYTGLRSPQIPVIVKAWHHKYFYVDVNESDISIDQGILSFVLNVQADRYPDEPVYPMTVSLVTDTLQWEVDKVSETRYKCKMWTIGEGTTNIVVQVKEQGCPPASFSFEATYVKPASKAQNKPAMKENIVIKKKPKVAPKPTPAQTPHLDI